MKRLLMMIAALLAAACQPIPQQGEIDTADAAPALQVSASDAAGDCDRRGGKMQPVGRLQTMQCVVTYADAGRRCTDSDQCAGECRVADGGARPSEGTAVVGQCQASSNRFGCFTRVEDGKAEATLCVD